MRLSGSAVTSSLVNSAITDAGALVRKMLSGRRNASTPEQERRLAKTLERLSPAANGAPPGPDCGTAAPATPSFESVLAQFSHV